jgi:8-oxo-dGTP pyrophosphatase MutT (NUDIX family)
MNYCPVCGKRLSEKAIKNKNVKACSCGFIDWDNWVHIAAVVAGFNEQNECLMVRLKQNGKITFPGGYRDLYESLEEAAAREFFEETGYRIKNVELFRVYSDDEQRLIWVTYKARLAGGAFQENDESSEILFFSKEHKPKPEELRGPLTKRLHHDVFES